MFTKICGIQTLPEALMCAEAGCDALGFLMALTHRAEDKIHPNRAKNIIQYLPASLEKVMVTHSKNADEIVEVARYTGVNTIQIHDYPDPYCLEEIRKRIPGIVLVKTVHVEGDSEEVFRRVSQAVLFADRILLDSRTKDKLGGTGKVHDWMISKDVANLSSLPVILAGGLQPENVEEAINTVLPFGVDVNSGVENPDGSKDPEKIRQFVLRAKK